MSRWLPQCVRSWVVLSVVLGAVFAAGCKGKTEPAAAAIDPETQRAALGLPDGTNVLAALEQKDFESAVAGLVKVQQSISTGDQESHFLLLKRHVKEVLLESAPNDPKAAEALNAYRLLTQGR